MLVGRSLQKEKGFRLKQLLHCLYSGTGWFKKDVKSYDNYIAFNDSPKDIFGKTMSISDEVMWDYYRLLLQKDKLEINMLKKSHPMESKKALALELTALFYGKEVAG